MKPTLCVLLLVLGGIAQTRAQAPCVDFGIGQTPCNAVDWNPFFGTSSNPQIHRTNSCGVEPPIPGSCGSTGNNDVWATFTTGATDTLVNIEMIPSNNRDMVMHLYTVTDPCGAPIFNEVACADNNGIGSFNTGAETLYQDLDPFSTYFVRVEAKAATSIGNASTLDIFAPPQPPYSVGSTGGDFTTIQAAYDAIPSSPSTPYVIELLDSYNETLESYPLVFVPKGSSANSITIRPSAGSTNNFVSDGNPGNGNSMLIMDGCDYLTIDGRRGGTGATAWTFRNTNNSNSGGPVVTFENGATHCTLHSLTLEAEPDVLYGIVDVLGGGTPGNDENSIIACTLRDLTVGGNANYYPNSGIYSFGQSGLITNDNWLVDSCHFVDILQTTVLSYSVFVADNSSSWTISNNHFYMTAPPTLGNDNFYGFVQVGDGSGYRIENNYFGGRAPFASGGTFQFNSGTAAMDMVWFSSPDAGGTNVVTGNQFKNIEYTSTSNSAQELLDGVYYDSPSDLVFESNTFDSLRIINNGSVNSLGFAGLVDDEGANVNVISNRFGSILGEGTRNGATTSMIKFSSSSSGTKNVRENSFGGSTAGSIQVTSNSSLFGVLNAGSANLVVENNEFQNFLHDASTAPSSIIAHTGGTSQIIENRLHDLTFLSETTCNVIFNNSAADATIADNEIYETSFEPTGSFSFRLITTAGTGRVNLLQNTVGPNITADNEEEVHGLLLAGSGDFVVRGNSVQDVEATNMSSNTVLTGIGVLNGRGTVEDNVVEELVSYSTIGGFGLRGIYVESSNTTNIIGNEVNQLILADNPSTATLLGGINVQNGDGTIVGNFVGNLENNRTSSGAVCTGIDWENSTRDVFNNVVINENSGLNNDMNVFGISMRNSVGTSRVHFNTVQLSGTNQGGGSAFSACGYFQAITTLNLNNNLFQNLRMQGNGNYAISSDNSGTLNNDYNFLQVAEDPGRLAQNGGADEDFPTWQGNTFAPNSFEGNETLDGQGYAVSENDVPGAGISLAPLITEDRNGNARTAAPWIGAYEGSCAPLSGTYTIGGTSPDFPNFTDAVDDLSVCGVSGPVEFDVRDGIYNEQLTLPPITGNDATNTITFQSQSGDSTAVILQFAGTVTDNYTLWINGADYVTLNQLTLQALDPTNARVLVFDNESNNLLVENCVIQGVNATSNTTANVGIYSAGDNDDSCRFVNNRILLGSYGMYLRGVSAVDGEDSVMVENNIFEDQYRAGLYTFNLNSPRFERNYFTSSFTFASYSTIYGNGLTNDFAILNNHAYLPSTRGFGISLANSSGSNPEKGLVANNRIYLGSTSGIGFGVYISNSSFTKVYHNSIWTRTNDVVNGAAFWVGGTSSNISVQNNIFKNDNGSFAMNLNGPGLVDIMDNNCWYAPVANLGQIGGTDYVDLASWQAGSGLDPNSVSINPDFDSNSELILKTVPPSGLQIGVDLTADVPEDFEGDGRTVPAWLGADESNFFLYPEEPGAGYALDFDGLNDEVDLGDIDALDGTDEMTVEAWVQVNNLVGNAGIISKNLNALERWEILIGSVGFGGSDDFLIRMADGGTSFGFTSSDVIQPGKWMHIALVYNGTAATNADKLKFYVNGVQETLTFSGTIPATTPDNNAPVMLGSQPGSNLRGQLDEVRFWRLARAENEIRQTICQKITSVHPNYEELEAYYRFDDNGGSILQDFTGNFNGNLVGMDASTDWIFSGASLGDTSVYTYAGTAGLILQDVNTSRLTIGNLSGTPDSLHIYLVKDTANTILPPTGIDSLEYRSYFGSFHAARDPQPYELEINYAANPFINGTGRERGMRFVARGVNGDLWTLPDSTRGYPAQTHFINSTSGSFEIIEGFGSAPDTNISFSPDTVFCSGDSALVFRNSNQAVDAIEWYDAGTASVLADTASTGDTLIVRTSEEVLYAVKRNGLILYSDTIGTSTGTGGPGTYTWLGTQSTDWFDCKNWDTFSVPSNISDVRIPGGTPFDPLITGGTGSVKTLQINTMNGGILNINSDAGGRINISP